MNQVTFLAAGFNVFKSDLHYSTGSQVTQNSFKVDLERKKKDASNGLRVNKRN
jgi:hypothetical protein